MHSGRNIATAIIVAFVCALTLLGFIAWNIVAMLDRPASGVRQPVTADRPAGQPLPGKQ